MSNKDLPVFATLILIGIGFVWYQCQQAKLTLLTPLQVTENFYQEWISYSGEPPVRNPVTDRIYQRSEYATDGLKNKMDKIINSFGETPGGYDPVLCAQEKPESFSAEQVKTTEQTVEVLVKEDFYGKIKEVKVSLVLENNAWKIDNIECSPNAQTVQLYYYNEEKDKELNEGEIACTPEAVLPVERKVESENLIEDTIRLLIQGNLTEEEKEQGFTTEFPHQEFRLIESVLEEGTLTLVFTEVPGFTTGGSCRVGILRAQIEKTAEQFSEVEEVIIEPETLFQP